MFTYVLCVKHFWLTANPIVKEGGGTQSFFMRTKKGGSPSFFSDDKKKEVPRLFPVDIRKRGGDQVSQHRSGIFQCRQVFRTRHIEIYRNTSKDY